jgi:hypothetical protein
MTVPLVTFWACARRGRPRKANPRIHGDKQRVTIRLKGPDGSEFKVRLMVEKDMWQRMVGTLARRHPLSCSVLIQMLQQAICGRRTGQNRRRTGHEAGIARRHASLILAQPPAPARPRCRPRRAGRCARTHPAFGSVRRIWAVITPASGETSPAGVVSRPGRPLEALRKPGPVQSGETSRNS